jgi:ABC-type glycerol-3-phosphate transport system substrate-binding protein
MKALKKVLALTMALGTALSMTACGLGEHRENYDPNKTLLKIGLMEGGIGRVWMDEIVANYKAKNPDIEVEIVYKKEDYNHDKLLNSISTSGIDVYFVNGIYMHEFVAKDYFMDITELIDQEYEGEASILDRMNVDVLKDSYKINNKYYTIPYYMATFGMVYDIDLFEEKGFYFAADGTFVNPNSFTDGVYTGEGTLSAGPDGKTGTVDDGLPATYSQFKSLMEYMSLYNVDTFTWSGKDLYYRQRLLAAWWADYEGVDNWNLNLTFDGYDTGLKETITPETALKLQGQKGKQYATQFAYDVVRGGYFDDGAYNSGSQTHTAAQEEFLASCNTSNPIAILAEGQWWENEAQDMFNSMAKDDESMAYGTRRFGMMPVPKADDTAFAGAKSAERNTVTVGGGRSVVAINKKTELVDLAKDFFLFANSEESMQLFTKYSGCVRPYEYELTEAQYNYMTPFQRSTYDLVFDANTDIAFLDVMASDLRINNTSFFEGWMWKSKMSYATPDDPLTGFKDYSKATVAEYVKGLKDYYTTWPTN